MKFRDKDERRIPRHEYQKELQNTLLRSSGKVHPNDCRLETTQHVWRKVSFQSTTRNSPWNAKVAKVQTVLRRNTALIHNISQSSILWTAGSCWVSCISGSQEYRIEIEEPLQAQASSEELQLRKDNLEASLSVVISYFHLAIFNRKGHCSSF